MENYTATCAEFRSLLMQLNMELDADRAREDLMCLFTEIRAALRTADAGKESLIYEYARLVDEEDAYYLPHYAYEAGALLATNPPTEEETSDRQFVRYICRVGLDPEVQELKSAQSIMFNAILALIGDAPQLLVDFNELYRRCSCPNMNFAEHFFWKGYSYMAEVHGKTAS